MLLRELAPSLYHIAAKKNRTVQEALREGKWIADLGRKITQHHLGDFVKLFNMHDHVILTPDTPNDII